MADTLALLLDLDAGADEHVDRFHEEVEVVGDAIVAPLPHRLTVSVEGAGVLLGVSLTGLLERWAAELPGTALDTVGDYASDFCDWLERCDDLRRPRRAQAALACTVRDEFLGLRGALLDACDAADVDPAAPVGPRAAEVVASVCWARLRHLQALPACGRLDGVRPDEVEGFADLVTEARAWAFDDTPRTDEGDMLLEQIARALLVATESFSTDTVMTFVGSGRASSRPVSRTITIAAVIAGRLKAWPAAEPAGTATTRRGAWLAAAHASLDDALGGDDDLAAIHAALEDAHRVLWRGRLAAA